MTAGKVCSTSAGSTASDPPKAAMSPPGPVRATRPTMPTSTAPESARSVQTRATAVPFLISASSRSAMKRTKIWGLPRKPSPIRDSPRISAMVTAVQPVPPVQLIRSGEMVVSPDVTAPQPPAPTMATTGRMTRPRNISVPWKMSLQTTARNPPVVM